MNYQVGGIITMVVRDGKTLEECRSLAPFHNMVTDRGLDEFGGPNFMSVSSGNAGGALRHCRLGTSGVAPTPFDLSLGSQVASTRATTSTLVSGSVTSKSPYYAFSRITWRTAAFESDTNLAEVGFGSTADGPDLSVRALIKDDLGEPTTLTVLAGEVLDVTYEIRMYLPMDDTTGSVVIGGTTYNYTCRAIDPNAWAPSGGAVSSTAPSARAGNASLVSIDSTSNYTGTTSTVAGSLTTAAYVAGQHRRDATANFGLTAVTNGIKVLVVAFGRGKFQFLFEPALPKTNANTLSLSFRSGTWSRYEP